MDHNPTGNFVLDVLGILLLFGLMAMPGAIGAVLWYGIKVWFTSKIVKATWMGNQEGDADE